MTEPDETTYRLELPVGEAVGLFILLEKEPPPFIANATHGGPMGQRAALRSLIDRGVVRVDGARAEMAEGAARFADVLSSSTVVVRVHVARRDREMVVWYSPAGPRTVRTEITSDDSCRWLDLPTEKVGVALAVDCGLGAGRAVAPELDIQVSAEQYGVLLWEMERGSDEGTLALASLGVDEATARRLADAMGGALTAFNVSIARLVGDGDSALEVSSVAWLDAGLMGPIKVSGPDLAEVRVGLSGEELLRLTSVGDQELLEEVLGLLAPEAES